MGNSVKDVVSGSAGYGPVRRIFREIPQLKLYYITPASRVKWRKVLCINIG